MEEKKLLGWLKVEQESNRYIVLTGAHQMTMSDADELFERHGYVCTMSGSHGDKWKHTFFKMSKDAE